MSASDEPERDASAAENQNAAESMQSLDAKWEKKFLSLDAKLDQLMAGLASSSTERRSDETSGSKSTKRKRDPSPESLDSDSIVLGESDTEERDRDVLDLAVDYDEEDELIKELDDNLAEDEESGEKVSTSIATLANKRFETRLSDKKVTKLSEKYVRPSNCPKLCVPAVNKEIWRRIPSRARRNDLRSVYTQRLIVRAASATVKAMQAIREAQRTQKKTDLLESAVGNLTDSVAMLGHVTQDLSFRRRVAIKPHLNPNIAAGICAESVPVTDKLFGDNLSTAVKEAKDLDNIGAKIANFGPRHNRDNGGRHFNPKQFPGHSSFGNQSFLGRKNNFQGFRNRKPFSAFKRQNNKQ